MADQSTCMSPSCGMTIDGNFKKCPQCGGLMRTSASIRAFGWVFVVCGLMALLPLVWMGWWAFSAAGSFTGTSAQAASFTAFFAFLILLCLLASANGLYMVVTGGTNRKLFKAMFLAVAILVFGTWLVRRYAAIVA